MTTASVSFSIGAELGSSFKGAFTSTENQLKTLGSSIKGLNQASQSLSSYKSLKLDSIGLRKEWQSAENRVKSLALEISKTDKPGKELQSNFRKAKKEATNTKRAFIQNRESVNKLGKSLRETGVDTKNFANEQVRLGKALETLKKRQESLAYSQGLASKNLSMRSGYRSQILDVMALGGTLYGVVKPAMSFESAMADVKKVVEMNGEETAQMESEIKNLSRTIPLSLEGLAKIVAAGGQFGVAKEHLIGFTETAAKMSVAMDMTAEEAGQSMAKLSNVMGMPIDQIGKVGDVVNELSNKLAASGAEIVEVNLRAGAMGRSFGLSYNEISALAGSFLELGKSPEIAGTAINMMASRLKLLPNSTGKTRKAFNQLGLSMKSYTKLIEGGKGQEAILTVLEALTKVQGVKRAQLMQDIFGEQAQRHINSLVGGLDKYKANLKLVATESEYAGSMQKEFAARSATTENNIQLLKNSIAVIATNFGCVLLPNISKVVLKISDMSNRFAAFIENNPKLIKYLGLAVAGLISLKIGMFGLGYAFTFIAAPFLNAFVLFNKLRTGFSLFQLGMTSGIPKIITAFMTLGKVLLTNPVGLIITGIALGAVLLIKYWKPISAFFIKVFDPVIAVFKEVWDWVNRIWNKTVEVFGGIKDWVSDSKIGKAWNWAFRDDREKTKIKYKDRNKNSYKIKTPVNVGATIFEPNKSNQFLDSNNYNHVELPKSKLSENNQSSFVVNSPITINASPGMDEKEIANQIDLKLRKREEEAKRKQRGMNYDY